MNLRKNVIKSKANDFEEMGGSVESMRNINRHFKIGTLPNGDFSLDDLEKYINHLISIQESDGSWTVSSSPENLAGDEKIEFITFPSFLAVGTLIMASEYLSDRVFTHLNNSLERGIAILELKGFGEDSLFQEIEMVLMLIEAGAPLWLKNRREDKICEKLISELIALRNQIRNRLDTNDTILSFGGDYRPIFELVSSGLSLL